MYGNSCKIIERMVRSSNILSIIGLVEDEDDFENIIIREMKALAFNEDEIVECLEYHFGFDMSWHPMSVNHRK